MSHSEVPEQPTDHIDPTDQFDTDAPSTSLTSRPWVRPAILAGMTLGAIAIATINGDPTTVGGII
jgi:hypothetical protein